MLPPQHPEWAARVRDVLLRPPADVVALLGTDAVAVHADAELYAAYRYRPEPRLACPIAVFAAEHDALYRPAELAGWHALTSAQGTAPGAVRRYPGGHFYLRDRYPEILADLAADLFP
jgi:surfactin synthase thioesterase subunit